MTLRLLSYNIRKGGNGREELLAGVIRECTPDLVVLQESTDVKVVKRIAERAQMPHWGAREGYSLGFLSRFGPVEHAWHRPPGVRRAFLEIKLPSLTVFGIHLRAIHSNWTERGRVRELNALLEAVEARKNSFHILTGDFNTLAPGESLEMRRLPRRLRILAWTLGGRIRFRTIGILIGAGYRDGYRSLHTDEGFTFPVWDPHVRLDYVFLPTNFIERLKRCEVAAGVSNARLASDHFPLLAELDLGSE